MSKADLESKLDSLFAVYGRSTAIPEASANFSADIWAAIEARRSSRFFGFMAKLVSSGALAASLLLGILSALPQQTVEPEYLATYLEQPSASEQLELPYAILEADGAK